MKRLCPWAAHAGCKTVLQPDQSGSMAGGIAAHLHVVHGLAKPEAAHAANVALREDKP